MSDHVAEINQVLAAAGVLEHGPARIALVEEAVRLADARNDLKEGFRTRCALTAASVFAGQADVTLVAFSWRLAQCDRDPATFKERELLWEYKWVVENLPNFPEVTRPQIEAMLADMVRRYERAGSTLHAVHKKRRGVLLAMGDLAGAAAADAELAGTAQLAQRLPGLHGGLPGPISDGVRPRRGGAGRGGADPHGPAQMPRGAAPDVLPGPAAALAAGPAGGGHVLPPQRLSAHRAQPGIRPPDRQASPLPGAD